MRGLAQKVAVVTGAAKGLGRAIAARLSEEGCITCIIDLMEEGQLTAESISKETEQSVFFFRADITKEEELQAVFSQIERQLGRVHILVNNAAVFVFKGIEANAEDWNYINGVNVAGTSLVTKHCVPLMKGEGGSIVNVSSISGMIGQPNFATYNATKFAVRGLTKCWAIDLAKYNIRVNSVCPGYIQSESALQYCENRDLDPEIVNRRISHLHILGRQGSPDEVAAAVCFLASDDASFITAEDLVVDGGYIAK
ncbi:SDR family oxidoreductase [Paenibacillus athensensis]|uniref:Short-chain dehydrogenase n=1 Tax=Paenibacillus athensensis TaxID=1967502 RepID=A0A4Y8PXW6_9BACL|nr:SDR family oxidoreductase [Paenibacillus athensensis]MCD1259368.1 SDR family oxidoreductase [Paenibacillus athensensis]